MRIDILRSTQQTEEGGKEGGHVEEIITIHRQQLILSIKMPVSTVEIMVVKFGCLVVVVVVLGELAQDVFILFRILHVREMVVVV